MLTQERLKELLDYNFITGTFTWKVKIGKKVKVGSIAGALTTDKYRVVGIEGIKYRAHHLAFLYLTGSFPYDQIDHINRVRDCNAWHNLRESTHAENHQNRSLNSNNTSGYKGVSWCKSKNKWQMQIYFEGLVHFSFHDTAREAYEAYCKKKQELHSFHPHAE